MADRMRFTNRLANEKSPYLLQHAHNPVDWYPWGEEAFRKAKEQDKPIFLSIGYATCHWCHAMERESFENVQIAELMNEIFINIKVDREEMPEVDALYMDFAQSMMAGSAGWPLNLVLTTDLKPFFAATYLPQRSRAGMMGLKELIEKIAQVWKSPDKDKIISQANMVVELFESAVQLQGEEMPAKNGIDRAAEILFHISDPVYGGLKGAPKFPVGYQNEFLFRYSKLKQDTRALFLAERSLEMMHRGGIYDHLGGGFSRYSIDDRWHIPHFEKMLYDNALLADVYVNAWKVSRKPFYKEVANEVCAYVLKEMTDPEGGFYSAEDADSEGKEGYFYTWTWDELKSALEEKPFELFREYFGITEEGNFEGRNVLHAVQSMQDFATHKQMPFKELKAQICSAKKVLLELREKRIHPFKDRKILSCWNGLMIHALANAGAAFQEKAYILAAKKAADFIRTFLWDRESLFRRYKDGDILHRAVLDDYAYLIKGLLTLFETGAGFEYLDFALKLTEAVKAKFKSQNGAYYQSPVEEDTLLIRKALYADGAEPSGNAVHTENLLRLYAITGREEYLEDAEDVLKSVKKFLDVQSAGFFYHIMNLMRYYDQNKTLIVVAFDETQTGKEKLEHALFEHFAPHLSIVWLKPGDASKSTFLPSGLSFPPVLGKTTLYFCSQGTCHPPLTDLDKAVAEIEKL